MVLYKSDLDSHVSRIDLIGKRFDNFKRRKQTQNLKKVFYLGQFNPVVVFDEYDAGRPDVMFVIQRVLEAEKFHTLIKIKC